MTHGARTDSPATVTAIKRGGVTAQGEVELLGTAYRMTSVMTLDSIEDSALKEGDTAHVLAKAANVLPVKP